MRKVIFKFWVIAPMLFSSISVFSVQGQQTTKAGKVGSVDTGAVKAEGKIIFAKTCSPCHSKPTDPKTPTVTMLSHMEPQVVLNALNNGKMKPQASALTEAQREAVAQFVTNKMLKATSLADAAYTRFSLPAKGSALYDESGWGGNPAGTGYRTAAQAGINLANVKSLKLKWSFAFPNTNEVRCKPAVVGNWVIAACQSGDVYALNRHSGKIGWHVKAKVAIRSGMTIVRAPGVVTAYFADGATNTYAIDVRTGKILWTTRAGVDQQAMNTGSVAYYGGKVFVPISSIEVAMVLDSNYNCCTSSGGVAALDSKTGKVLWYHRVVSEAAVTTNMKKNGKPFYGPSGAPVWCSPTIDVKRGLLYIGTGENYSEPVTVSSDAIQALDINTGALVWNFQATSNDAWNMACPTVANCPGKTGRDLDFGMAPLLVKGADGKDRLLAGEKSGVVYALDPQRGTVLWKTRIGKGGALGGIHWGMAADGKKVYAANADNTLALNPDDTTAHAAPGIYALDIISGKVSWVAPTPKVVGKESYLGANSAAPIVVPGIVFAGSLDGNIRAYAAATGKIIWDYNTIREYKTANGATGKGGSIDSAPPIAAGGMLFVNSGYTQFGEKPGNVLLAFEVRK